jgi:WD40 repeat protein
MDTPLFESPSANEFVHSAIWSPTRPGLIITGKSDGTLDIWDLLDQCHKPSYTFSSGNEPIVSMQFWTGSEDAVQYLAVGDQSGKLHVVDMPRALRKINVDDKRQMGEFYEREHRRVGYFTTREGEHANERSRYV